MIDIQTLPIVTPKFYTAVTGVRTKRLIVMHDAEVPETTHSAEDVGRYFQHPDPGTKPSAHMISDNDSYVRCVRDNDVANAAPGANHDGLQWEMAGYGRQSRDEWLDEYGRELLALTCEGVAQWCVKYDIPARQLSDAELADHRTKGIVGHYQASRVFHLSDHTDPGPGFPWDVFLLGVGTSMSKIVVAPAEGDRRWSNYFKNWVYLVRYTSDTDWSFTVGQRNTGQVLKAQAAWSAMPRTP
jgi:N-acetylmuramoyl-L-alanine amidase